MKTHKYLLLASMAVLLVVGLLAAPMLFASLARAQNGTPGDENSAPESTTPTEEPVEESSPPVTNDPTGMQPDDPQPLDPAAVMIVNDVVQVQGRLTTPDGIPITGSRTLTVTIYDAASAGVARCTDSDPVDVTDGLFTMNMDFCTATDINGDALFLGIQVGSDPEMTPRQEIFAVPYAWALRPGAIIKGADSYVFTPGNALIKNLSTDTTRWDIQANGGARIWRGATAGSKVIYFPVAFPSVLYGQNVTLEQLTVFYRSSNATNAYITRTALNVQTNASSFVIVIDDLTDRSSTTATSYSLNLTNNNVISSSQGAIGMFITLTFSNDTDYVDIGAIRLRLGHP